MPVETIIKIIFLVVITILAGISLVIGKVMMNKKTGGKNAYNLRRVVRIRMACFLTMMVLLLIVILI